MKSTIALTIGRNVGDTPMPAKNWVAFTNAAYSLVGGNIPPIHGDGVWQGVINEDACLIFGTRQPQLPKLRALLAEYGQSAAGLFRPVPFGTYVHGGSLLRAHPFEPDEIAARGGLEVVFTAEDSPHHMPWAVAIAPGPRTRTAQGEWLGGLVEA